MLDLEAIKKREAAATPGPWIFDAQGDWEISTPMNLGGYSTVIVCGMLGEHENIFEDTYPIATWQDGEFIAHAREDIPALIAEVERLHKALDSYARTNDELIKEVVKLRGSNRWTT